MKLLLNLSSLLFSLIDRIATLTTTEFASISWESSSSLGTWDLAKTTFAGLTKCFHAVFATTVLHFKFEIVIVRVSG